MATATQPPSQETTTQLARKPESLQSLLEKMKGQISVALPRHLTAERMIRVCLTAVQRSKDLKQCTPLSIVGALVQASQLGLEPDGILGQAYLVPFNNRKTGQKEAQLQIGYRGFLTLARRSGEVSNIYSELVFDCDFFHCQLGTDKKLEHIPNYDAPERGNVNEDTGELIGLKGAYAVVKYKIGAIDFEYMPLRELDRIRFSSQAKDFGPWVTHPAEMYKKCPIRRLAKRLPLSPEFMKAGVHDEYVDSGVGASPAAELIDIDEPIFQDTQDYAIAEKGEETLNNIKEKYRPREPRSAATETSSATEKISKAVAMEQAQEAHAYVRTVAMQEAQEALAETLAKRAKRRPPTTTTTTSSGEPQSVSDTESGDW